ncbi:hypothetical protein Arub01_50940 [Actinomadura rubrobrunea]|uniref:Uncharacterized protein n=1 Tax=Actinomadura rubrobrunea TaxID=115335 RepID=A0A9W6PYR0_9ACTN|nr:hypothetical protein Arub01_50940 [Actinomadura rubrobrunea]
MPAAYELVTRPFEHAARPTGKQVAVDIPLTGVISGRLPPQVDGARALASGQGRGRLAGEVDVRPGGPVRARRRLGEEPRPGTVNACGGISPRDGPLAPAATREPSAGRADTGCPWGSGTC